jgi:hypothetical protein
VKLLAAILPMILFTAFATANWEYGDGAAGGGGRMTVSVRGGVAMPFASMKSELGGVTLLYYTDGSVLYNNNTCGGGGCTPTTPVAEADLGKMPLAKKYDSFSWAGGAGVGFVPDGRPNVRMELDWLHISETDYDSNPLFLDELTITGLGTYPNPVAAAKSTVSTDVVSAMIYYDFFAGPRRPAGQAVPYVGAGLGYATSTSVLALSDSYGDLQADISICSDFGEQVGGLCQYYTSTTHTNNFAVSAAAGVSYGLDEGVFLDFGARASYVPRIRWGLNNDGNENATTPKNRDMFSARDVVFLNVYAGVRFEF